ncbi:MAG TPA: TIGR03118 family protein, partial [Myxococcaceae bacterium]
MSPHPARWPAVSLGLLAAGLCTDAMAQSFTITRLDSDVPGAAAAVDPQLVAPVGLSRGILGPWWVSDSGSGLSTLYGGDGGKRGLVVALPSPPGSTAPARPTGTVFHG